MSHTPGPWFFDLNTGGLDYSIYESAANSVERDYYSGALAEVNSESNARLIAAAPELLEACKLMVDDQSPENHLHNLEMLRLAIAKAEGKL